MEFQEGASVQEMLAKKAEELFSICDRECKSFITKRDMQRLIGELPLTPDQLEEVFDTLDEDRNGYLTLQEFTEGFGMFLGIDTNLHHNPEVDTIPEGDERQLEEEEGVNDEQIAALLESLDAHQLFADQQEHLRSIWRHLRRVDESDMAMADFEAFVSKVVSDIRKTKSACNELETALKTRTSMHEEELRRMYEEMEQQLRNDREQLLAEEKAKERKVRQELEDELLQKDQQLQGLLARQTQMNRQLETLNATDTATKQEKNRLETERDKLAKKLESSEKVIWELQGNLQTLKQQQKNENRERARAAMKVTEGIAMEREGLVKQLDILRSVNKQLRDDQDIRTDTTSEEKSPLLARKGSSLGPYLQEPLAKQPKEIFVPPKETCSEESLKDFLSPKGNTPPPIVLDDSYEVDDIFYHHLPDGIDSVLGSMMTKAKMFCSTELDDKEEGKFFSNESTPFLTPNLSPVTTRSTNTAKAETNDNEKMALDIVTAVHRVSPEPTIDLPKSPASPVSESQAENGWHDTEQTVLTQNRKEGLSLQLEAGRRRSLPSGFVRSVALTNNFLKIEHHEGTVTVVDYEQKEDSSEDNGEYGRRTREIVRSLSGDGILPFVNGNVLPITAGTYPRNARQDTGTHQRVIETEKDIDKKVSPERTTESEEPNEGEEKWVSSNWSAEVRAPLARQESSSLQTTKSSSLNPFGSSDEEENVTTWKIGREADTVSQFSNASRSSSPERIFKVVFVGDSGVGKSSFIYRFCHSSFKPTFSATIGVDFQVKTIEVNGHTVALQLWDTAGQERFRSITKQYYRKADGVIIMYDVTSELSFKSVRNWMEDVKEGADEQTVVLLVGNKVDMCLDANDRVIQTKDGNRLADDYASLFYETSAKTGEGVHQAMLGMSMLLQEREDEVIERALRLQEGLTKKKCC